MSPDFAERRRTPRIEVRPGDARASTSTATVVQLIDISQSGVLLSSPEKLDVGRRAQLRTRIGAEPLAVQVEVRRVAEHARSGHGAYRLGVAFVSPDPETERKLERFLKIED